MGNFLGHIFIIIVYGSIPIGILGTISPFLGAILAIGFLFYSVSSFQNNVLTLSKPKLIFGREGIHVANNIILWNDIQTIKARRDYDSGANVIRDFLIIESCNYPELTIIDIKGIDAPWKMLADLNLYSEHFSGRKYDFCS